MMIVRLSRTTLAVLLLAGTLITLSHSVAAESAVAKNLLTNGSFEQGDYGWDRPWARDKKIEATLSKSIKHHGKYAVRIKYEGDKDWSLPWKQHLEVKPGEIFRITGWARVHGDGTVKPCVVLHDQEHQPMRWSYGECSLKASKGWQPFDFRFAIPNGCRWISFRVTGHGAATAYVDAMSLMRKGKLDQKTSRLAKPLAIENDLVRLEFSHEDGTCSLHDKRTGKTWQQAKQVSRKKTEVFISVLDAQKIPNGIVAKLIDPESMLEFTVTWRLVPDAAEVSVELEGDGPMNINLGYPYPYVSAKDREHDWLVLPLNEGIAYPIDDETLEPTWYNLFSGHGLCMGWYGVADLEVGKKADRGGDGLMTIVETPNDAAVHTPRKEGRFCLAPKWSPEKGKFGPKRKLRYVLFDHGGYVAMCKRYRAHAKEIGLLKTLAEKREENPDVDLLVGAVNVWCWDKGPVAKCKELQSLGIDRILWSKKSEPDEIRQMNELGVLTSRYDIYQDCMDPANFPKLKAVFSDVWTSDRWPDGIIITKTGDWARGWEMPGKKEGESYFCGRLCDGFTPDYARGRVAEELKTHPYRCRFIDTTTAMPWVECYSSDHPMTRTESRQFRMELLEVISREFKQVTGSETGHEAAVPYLHYFEGMLSLGPYRVPDAGRAMMRPWHDVPERVAKFQMGHKYRIPLWELVYHDCVVAQWYWGDYNNKLPSLWNRRDLFNLLYNTPAMFMFNQKIWEANEKRFIQSYKTTHQLPRETGYAEMISHRWLTDDHAVQQTCFSNGVCVTVNFGEVLYTTATGKRIEPLGYVVEKEPRKNRTE